MTFRLFRRVFHFVRLAQRRPTIFPAASHKEPKTRRAASGFFPVAMVAKEVIGIAGVQRGLQKHAGNLHVSHFLKAPIRGHHLAGNHSKSPQRDQVPTDRWIELQP